MKMNETGSVSRRDWLRLGLAASAAAALALPAGVAQSAPARLRGFRGAYFPNVEVVAHTGHRLRFYDDVLKGKMVMLNFTYASCDGACPAVTANLKAVYAKLGDRVGRDIFMYSITLRPEADTPDVLRHHVEQLGIGPGWLFLRASNADVDLLRRRFGATDPDPAIDADTTQHTGMLFLGNEPLERWIGCPGEARSEWIAKTMLRLEGPQRASGEKT
jgi:protein SCO1/2